MNKKKIALAAATFFVAISGAFATSMLLPFASVSKTDRPSQSLQCEELIECSNTGEFVCQVQIAGVTYPLKDRTATTVCVNLLTHDEFFAAILP
jgi:hypothetical protein